ncbi:Similarity (fragment) [Microcystis aeruginosa PCC 9809]
MAADIENTMQEIVEEAEANRQLDLRRINDL